MRFVTTPIPITEDADPGRKYDEGKPRFDLIPPLASLDLAHVLEFGSRKYSDDNWKKVSDLEKRYLRAALSHINAHQRGQCFDSETNRLHLTHAVASLMFVIEHLSVEMEIDELFK